MTAEKRPGLPLLSPLLHFLPEGDDVVVNFVLCCTESVCRLLESVLVMCEVIWKCKGITVREYGAAMQNRGLGKQGSCLCRCG